MIQIASHSFLSLLYGLVPCILVFLGVRVGLDVTLGENVECFREQLMHEIFGLLLQELKNIMLFVHDSKLND